jgi:hypothetical protein
VEDDAMKIKLIAPHQLSGDNISSAQTFKVQKANLPLLAALTPPKHSIKIIDEAFAPDDIDEEVDLAGITVMTDLAPRAYEIADTYQRRGVKDSRPGDDGTYFSFLSNGSLTAEYPLFKGADVSPLNFTFYSLLYLAYYLGWEFFFAAICSSDWGKDWEIGTPFSFRPWHPVSLPALLLHWLLGICLDAFIIYF